MAAVQARGKTRPRNEAGAPPARREFCHQYVSVCQSEYPFAIVDWSRHIIFLPINIVKLALLQNILPALRRPYAAPATAMRRQPISQCLGKPELPASLPQGVGKLFGFIYMLGFSKPLPGASAKSKSSWTIAAVSAG